VAQRRGARRLAYARTDIGGADRWDDRTDRWIPLTDHLGRDDRNLLDAEAMAVDPDHPNRVYLALITARPRPGPPRRQQARRAVGGARLMPDLSAHCPSRHVELIRAPDGRRPS
jgi:hypothetical protein